VGINRDPDSKMSYWPLILVRSKVKFHEDKTSNMDA
jgi:hypothetical protein